MTAPSVVPGRPMPEPSFPVMVDDAGVEWTLDVMRFGKSPRPFLCVCDKPGGQLGFSLVGLEGGFASVNSRLPASADRIALVKTLLEIPQQSASVPSRDAGGADQ